MKTQKWYYLHNMRSAYFPINRRLHRERERAREREREKVRERSRQGGTQREIETESERERHETVKTHKQYYLCNMTSSYFLINRTLHREREQERESQRQR